MHNKYLKSNYNIENEYFEVLSYYGYELIRQNPPCFAQLPQDNLKYYLDFIEFAPYPNGIA